jgi:simple sugar transport system ATP-binding protein
MSDGGAMSISADGQAPEDRNLSGENVILRTEGIAKAFGAVVALRSINLELRRGEVLGLVGDNGAGKSTFVKILTGFHRPDAGRIFLESKEVRFRSVKEARANGIETVYQDLALVPQLPVYLNLFLNREQTSFGQVGWLSKRKMRRLARQYLDEIKVNIPNIDAEVESLSGGQRQAIAVARATQQQAKILLLDEPLAAMGAKESAMIIDLVKDLSRNRKETMIIIDHNHTHLFELCDRLAVIQRGTITFDKPVKDTSIEELTELMVSSYRAQVLAGQRELRAS